VYNNGYAVEVSFDYNEDVYTDIQVTDTVLHDVEDYLEYELQSIFGVSNIKIKVIAKQ
jgi:hypothetical protein